MLHPDIAITMMTASIALAEFRNIYSLTTGAEKARWFHRNIPDVWINGYSPNRLFHSITSVATRITDKVTGQVSEGLVSLWYRQPASARREVVETNAGKDHSIDETDAVSFPHIERSDV